jgi:MFS transporter, ACS family, D-galactonate transporter
VPLLGVVAQAEGERATIRLGMEPRKFRPFALPLLLLALSVLINYIDRGNLSIAAPLLKNELSISASQLGILLSAFFWSYTVLLFVWGCVIDRFDVNRVLAFGYLVWSVATAVTGMVHGFVLLLLMRLALGAGESVAFPCYSKILAQHLPEHRRGFANGAIIAAMKCGPVVGTLGAGILMAKYGWRPVFIGIGLLSLAWLPAWMTVMPCTAASADLGVCPRVTDILRQRSFWATAAGGFCLAYPLYFMVTWLPFYLVHEQRLSMRNMVNVAALYYTIDAAAALVTGWITDFWIGRGLAAGDIRKAAMALGWTVAAIGFVRCSSAGPHSYLAWLMVTGVGCGIGNSGIWAFSQTLAGPQAVGRWVGLQNGFANLAGVVGPALTGFVVDWTGHFRAALLITAGTCLLSGVSWVFLVGRLEQVVWTRGAESDLAATVPEII